MLSEGIHVCPKFPRVSTRKKDNSALKLSDTKGNSASSMRARRNKISKLSLDKRNQILVLPHIDYKISMLNTL